MGEKKIILIIDAKNEDRSILMQIGKKHPEYYFLEADTVGRALDLLESGKKPDLILLDIVSPNLDGLRLLNFFKKNERFRNVPVLAGTLPGAAEVSRKAAKLGVADFLMKPYDVPNAEACIEKAIHNGTVQEERDPLTGLYTAESFYTETAKMLRENAGTEYTLLFFNLANFALVNDLQGREIGDDILKQIASTMASGMHHKGVCGRVADDHFVCCIETEHPGDELGFYEYMESRVRKLAWQFHFTLECGIYPIDDITLSVKDMCDRGEFALGDVKGIHLEKYAYYDKRTAEKYYHEQMMIADREKALTEGQFYVVFQPVFDAVTERPIGAEALVRWRHPVLGVISPQRYIPLFEKDGFIHKLDLFVWEEACKVLADLKKRGGALRPISVNVSRIDLYHPDLADSVERLLAKYQIEKKYLYLEITESAYVEQPQEMINVVSNLRNRGFKILMDDFGSGYSSLNMLKDLPVDVLKIDMDFMQQLESSRRAGNIVISIIRMAKLLHINTVAEGVETKEQKEFIKNIGCDEIQGYYFAKPMPADEFCSFMMKQPRQQKDRTGYKKGVLVVDDVTVIRKSLVQALGDEYTYYEAANGQQALDILKTEASQISIIITDVFMPVMDGFELIGKLQENPIYNHIPIIVVTVSEERENEIKALKLGAVDVITKPYDPVSAKHRVKNVLKIAEAERLQMEINLLNEKNMK